eukprot:CAMPEP_0201217690 /NCGR_PEP_ID=MMETSP0851-20130426/190187_1 /ASSEMBLY_ACC=CAM_ASM_000631 /TAXON_ID=183588 /ORGANISM="Pseudo-nitzschia fraudulenta, Strain WWA7" /LENGTH=431 /DNA_ID=CAMNT_0047507343 /DNA_START=163 /DNA_END=1459 /DNA_ORIENTATION=-
MRSKEADNNNDTTWPPHSRIAEAFDHLRRNDKEIFLLDGGTGEELFRRNVPDDRKIWSATALVHPEYHSVLEDVHASFLRSGSNAITTNSYGVVPGVGFDDDQISEYTRESGRIARGAAKKHDDAGTDSSTAPAFVLGSLGPLLESYRPDKLMPRDEGVKSYELACRSLVPHVDAFLAETMSCVDESIQVVDAVANNGTGSTPTATEGQQQRSLLVSYSVDPEGNFRDGEKTSDGILRILEHAEAQRARVRLLAILFNCSEPEQREEFGVGVHRLNCVDDVPLFFHARFSILPRLVSSRACFWFLCSRPHSTAVAIFFFAVLAILFNCSEPEAIGKALERIHDDSDLVHKLNDDGVLLGAYANRLAQIDPSWTLAESEAPQPFRNDLSKEIYWKDFVEIWIDKFNVRVVGGCCGITPEHIRYIRAEVDKRV